MGTLIQATCQTPLYEEVQGLTPWEAVQRLADLGHLLFLDSAAVSEQGRYAYVSADPFAWLTAKPGDLDPFTRIQAWMRSFRLTRIPELPTFQGGAAGLFGYELCHHLEKLPRTRHVDFDIPDLAVGIYDWVLAFDLLQNRAWLISTGFPEMEPHRRLLHARKRMDQVKRLLERASAPRIWSHESRSPLETPSYPVPGLDSITSNFDRDHYLATIRRAIDYIHAGDCFQVNIAQRLITPAHSHPLDTYESLRSLNPAPFAGYFDLGSYAILSASPERFVQFKDGLVRTCPIKGTRPRGLTPTEDARLAEELRRSSKDRAENVMIVDLLRNDLGRVCSFGSISVEAVCRLESYRYVHHLVSEVHGQLRPELDAIDLLRACFPGGSVTGAPKIRAMEIITELEQTARGPYCGSLGYLGFDGSLDTNLLIRTMVQGQGWLHFSVGGGIVADSDPEKEYDETWHKAAGLVRALSRDE